MNYLDNSATTKVCEKACEKAVYIMTECFGNPSSLHKLGFLAERELRQAREIVLNSISSQGTVVFTSGGTESNNLAIFGAVNQNYRNGKRIVTSSIEHPSVINCMKELEAKGFDVVYLNPNSDGVIEKNDIYNAVTSDTILVSLMSVNNETGYILPLEAVQTAIKRTGSKALFHVDNVQGFLKENINPQRLGIDLMSVSGHKVHAPKGVGALYIVKNKRIKPIIFGGGQENSVRSGTENLPSICAFAEAIKNYKKNAEIKFLKKELKEKLLENPMIKINSQENSSDYILNFSLGKIKGETMLHFLAERDIFVSTGSACSGAKASHVLASMGYDNERISSSLRVSFSNNTQKEDIVALLKAIDQGFAELAHVK